jgi:predicted house-cleaning NTP pyrophosphatase (Maf/HAM1 superfamily)
MTPINSNASAGACFIQEASACFIQAKAPSQRPTMVLPLRNLLQNLK